MSDDEQIRCFFHCTMKKSVLAIHLPDKCPLCYLPLLHYPFRVPPFFVPSPFHYHLKSIIGNESNHQPVKPFSMLVKPTNGHFLLSYNDGEDLHVGLTDSQGNVFNFAQGGVVVQQDGWDCCLCVRIVESRDSDVIDLEERWDGLLLSSIDSEEWLSKKYNEDSYNCYDYVINMLTKTLQIKISKESFCNRQILPESRRAVKYIALYRELLEKQSIVRNNVKK